ncbi:SdrD B-like domain-containing protein, partial [Lacinutrix cladophorae]
VFADLDGDGVLDAGEPTGTTAADGTYTIDGVPAGTVDIVVDTTTLPANVNLTEGTEPTEVTVPASGTVDAGNDGYAPAVGDLSGVVFEDLNGDGIQDPGEEGIEGVEVVITDVNGDETTVTTGTDG